MGRIFSLLAAVSVLMILVTGAGVYWLASAKIAQARQDSAIAVANAVALSLSQQLDLLNRTLNKMAQDPEVLIAVTRADPVLLSAVAARLENYFPDALKIRLLLPGISEIDEKSVPRMGFADLDMVRETFSKDQPPKIQGYEGADRHLAITTRIMQNDQVVGVTLASLNYGFFNKTMQATGVKNGTIELRQAKRVLGSSGGPVDTGQSESVQVKVANTDWEIYYHYAAGADSSEIILITSIITAAILLTILAIFVGYRRLSVLMAQDLDTVLKACKDMLTQQPPGSYPVNLGAPGAVIMALVKFKRLLDPDEGPARYDIPDKLPEYDVNENFIKED
jgi:phosphomannomutase/phosphoglucomutase